MKTFIFTATVTLAVFATGANAQFFSAGFQNPCIQCTCCNGQQTCINQNPGQFCPLLLGCKPAGYCGCNNNQQYSQSSCSSGSCGCSSCNSNNNGMAILLTPAQQNCCQQSSCGCQQQSCGCQQQSCGCQQQSCGCQQQSCGCQQQSCGCQQAVYFLGRFLCPQQQQQTSGFGNIFTINGQNFIRIFRRRH